MRKRSRRIATVSTRNDEQIAKEKYVIVKNFGDLRSGTFLNQKQDWKD
jgi:hypothetical protein